MEFLKPNNGDVADKSSDWSIAPSEIMKHERAFPER